MDMNKLLAQAQQMQQRMQETQEQLGEERVKAESGGGMVKVVFNGRQELVSLLIDPSVVKSDEVEFLEDLIVAAMQEGHRRAAELAQKKMGQLGGGMSIPGLF
ncbi:MAG TPA: YbaB/EbfC family nucleoid-associated protein [Candidatus Krumholzibacteria bacterium]|jgi:DNA-binding YbaB/EbfC family protein